MPENDPSALAIAIEKIVFTFETPNQAEREAWLALHDRRYLANQLIVHPDNIVING